MLTESTEENEQQKSTNEQIIKLPPGSASVHSDPTDEQIEVMESVQSGGNATETSSKSDIITAAAQECAENVIVAGVNMESSDLDAIQTVPNVELSNVIEETDFQTKDCVTPDKVKETQKQKIAEQNFIRPDAN